MACVGEKASVADYIFGKGFRNAVISPITVLSWKRTERADSCDLLLSLGAL